MSKKNNITKFIEKHIAQSKTLTEQQIRDIVEKRGINNVFLQRKGLVKANQIIKEIDNSLSKLIDVTSKKTETLKKDDIVNLIEQKKIYNTIDKKGYIYAKNVVLKKNRILTKKNNIQKIIEEEKQKQKELKQIQKQLKHIQKQEEEAKKEKSVRLLSPEEIEEIELKKKFDNAKMSINHFAYQKSLKMLEEDNAEIKRLRELKGLYVKDRQGYNRLQELEMETYNHALNISKEKNSYMLFSILYLGDNIPKEKRYCTISTEIILPNIASLYTKNNNNVNILNSNILTQYVNSIKTNAGALEYIKLLIIQKHQNRIYKNGVKEALNRSKSIIFSQIKALDGSILYKNLKMKGTKLQYKILGPKNSENFEKRIFEEDMCVLEYILNNLTKDEFPKLNPIVLREQFAEINPDYKDGVTYIELIEWANNFYKNSINVFVFDPFFRLIAKQINTRHHVKASLHFCINNGHIYAIKNEVLREKAGYLQKDEFLELTDNSGFNMKLDEIVIYKKVNSENFETFFNNQETYNGDDLEECRKYLNILKGDCESQIGFATDNIDEVITDISKYLNIITVAFHKKKALGVTSMLHPINGEVYICAAGTDYYERTYLCTELAKIYPNNYSFQWRNQSISTMAKSLFHAQYGKIETSNFGDYDKKMNKFFNTTQIVKTYIPNITKNENCYGFDVKKSYQTALLEMEFDYCYFDIDCEWEEYKGEDIQCAEYLVDNVECKLTEKINMPLKKSIYGADLVKYLLDNNYISKSDILYIKKPVQTIDNKILKNFVQGLLNNEQISKITREVIKNDKIEHEPMTKLLINAFIGSLGTHESKSRRVMMSDDWFTVNAAYNYYGHDSVMVDERNGIYFCQLELKTEMSSTHSPIHRQIISRGIINLLNMIKYVSDDNTILCGVNTDACFVINPKIKDINNIPDSDPNKKRYKNEEWKPKMFHSEKYTNESDHKMFIGGLHKNYRTIKYDTTMEEEKDVLPQIRYEDGVPQCLDYVEIGPKNIVKYLDNKSFICDASGGTGKTHLLSTITKEGQLGDDTYVFSFTNKSVSNLLNAGVKNVYTLSSYFQNNDKLPKKCKKIVIDEYTMCPIYFYRMIAKLKEERRAQGEQLIINLFGDYKQCKAVSDKYYIKHIEKVFIKRLVDYNQVVLSYNEKFARYDKRTHRMLTNFWETGKLENVFGKIDNKLITNISYLNYTRGLINDMCFKLQGGQIKEGMKVIAKKNSKGLKIYNSEFYWIHEVSTNKKNIILVKIKNDKGEVITPTPITYAKYFEPAYCVTVYKYQGSTIDQPYNIFDCQYFSKNELYTALSRAKSIDLIHIDYEMFKNVVFVEYEGPKTQLKYELLKTQLGSIYEITNGKNYYVGQTCQTLEERLNEHFVCEESQIFINIKEGKSKKEDWSIKLITQVHYFENPTKVIQNKYSLNQCEKRYIKLYKEKYGDNLLNILCAKDAKKNENIEAKDIQRLQKIEQEIIQKSIFKTELNFKYGESNNKKYVYVKKVIGQNVIRKQYNYSDAKTKKIAELKIKTFATEVIKEKTKKPEIKFSDIIKQVDEKIKGGFLISFDDD